MQLPALITSDVHFTARPADEYRWGLWPWLRKQCEKERAQSLLILGDLTDSKDYHCAELVNRIVKEVKATLVCVPAIYILMGNHDFLRRGHPFFGFLSALEGVHFIDKPLDTTGHGEAALFLPYTKTPLKDWAGFDFSHYRWVFIHQTVNGSIASNGQKMDGDLFPDMSAAGKIYSGDIHLAQTVSGVEYVGSPYHVHFGDAFKPRSLLLDSFGRAVDLHFRTTSRITLDAGAMDLGRLSDLHRLRTGDQVKIRIHLGADELHEWHAIKRLAADEMKKAGVDLFGIELIPPKTRRRFEDSDSPRLAVSSRPQDILYNFVEREGLGPDALDVGLDLLE